jgi:hypothetical protein
MVKFAFRGDGRSLIKDLDNDILAKNGPSISSRHELASSAIARLRKGSVQTINDLLITLGSRQASWSRDMAIISALLVGVDIEGIEHQQDIYQAILKNIKGLRHPHLFHNLPTVFKAPVGHL